MRLSVRIHKTLTPLRAPENSLYQYVLPGYLVLLLLRIGMWLFFLCIKEQVSKGCEIRIIILFVKYFFQVCFNACFIMFYAFYLEAYTITQSTDIAAG